MTFGFQVRNIITDDFPEIILITSIGASLGGCLNIYKWNIKDFNNISPVNNTEFHKFNFQDINNDNNEEIILYNKDSNGTLNSSPIIYRWEKDLFHKESGRF